MAGRMISREIFLSQDVVRMTPCQKLVWITMIILADDEGITPGDDVLYVRLLCGTRGALRVTDVCTTFALVVSQGMATCVERSGSKYFKLTNFLKWQRLSNVRESTRIEGKAKQRNRIEGKQEEVAASRKTSGSLPTNGRTNPDHSKRSNPFGKGQATLKNLKIEEIKNPVRLLERYEEAVHVGLIDGSESDRLRFFAGAAVAIRRTDLKSPEGFFIDFLRQKTFDGIQDQDEVWAKARIQEVINGGE